MKAVVFERFGNPDEVLQVRDAPEPTPGKNQVRVRMRASPVNPSDLLVVRGQYGRLPSLPATPGFEGVGVIDALGGGLLKYLRGLRPGRRVAVLNGPGGNWQEKVVVSARHVVQLPDDVADEQGASFFVNPATALVMTRRVLAVPKGGWLLQTAAASALGRMIIRLGKFDGFRTINLVRRREQADELRALGADEVLSTQADDVVSKVKAFTGGEGVRYAVDAVGADTGLTAVRCMGSGGRLLVYGTLAGQPIPLDPRLLIAGQKRIEGFWLSDWVRQQGALTMLRLFRQIISLMRSGVLTTVVQAAFPLDQIREAVRLAEQPGRTGKVLLRC
ncbi:MAG: zinc-dependent alcohol dehydrogenase family protein [Gemmataceae bacterium]|nr:zinc-dependent alcohol dehydrogenase family protein [Gemmataceae bacterium]MCI0738547.1 zinc-dependent alcohol dehydrogenase family protein [Gemmataceae bacterium]